MNSKRTQWSNKLEFYLSTIGYSVGIGNINRFPYVLLENGGGTFLIPYFFFLFICGAPLFFAESSMGQFTSISVIGTWNFAPVFRGLGWGMVCASTVVCIYYIILMAWVLYYLGMSFQWNLPWSSCTNPWNTKYCYSFTDMVQNNQSFQEHIQSRNMSLHLSNSSERWKSSAEEFYLFKALDITSSIDEIGSFNVPILICFIVAWIITYLCVVKGASSIGKSVYITATLPYILLTVLIIQGAVLPGSLNGIKFYLIPKWEILLTVKVWVTAASQIFYSLGPGWGGIIMMASYNDFNHDIVKTSIIIPIICCLTSVYGGFAIFSIIGHMSYMTNVTDISRVIDSGPGLSFVAYPQALSLLPGGAILSIMFFLMLFILGLGSMFGTYQTILQGLADEFPFLRGKVYYVFTALFTLFMILVGLIFTTRAGGYYYQIIDWYSTPIAIIIISVIESIIIPAFYNIWELLKHIEMMIKRSIPCFIKYWFLACILCLTPLSLTIVLINATMSFGEPKFNNEKPYPKWAISLGWAFAGFIILPVPIVALKVIIQNRKNVRRIIRPTKEFIEIEKFRMATMQVDEEEMKNLNSVST